MPRPSTRPTTALRHAVAALDPALAGDALAILEVLGRCSPDERAVLRLVAEGLDAGRRRYGPLDLETDRRDMLAEGLEEIRDCLTYVGAALVRLGRRG